MHGFIVTGTDTGVGKSLISAALLLRLSQRFARVAGYKPIAAGCEADGSNEDVELLRQFSQPPISAAQCCTYLLGSACAPHLAAQEEDMPLQAAPIVQGALALAAQNDALVVEGAGGLLVPLSIHPRLDTADVFAQLHRALQLPIVLVVGMRLGCINHALLTAEVLTARGLPLAGWVANGLETDMPYMDDNILALQALLPAPLLGTVPFMPALPLHARVALAAECLQTVALA
jgi:dethiobiotin synthetase